MSTPETTDGAETDAPTYCEECGTLAAGRYCPGCGQQVARKDDATDEHEGDAAREASETDEAAGAADPPPTHEWSEPAETGHVESSDAHRPVAAHAVGKRPSRRRAPLIAGVLVAAVLIAGGVAAVLLLGTKGDDAGATYRQRVATAFGPVLGANRQVSDELARLNGTKPTNARLATRSAQQATTLATGAVSALSAPPGSQDLARDTRQVLDRETAYLSAVAAVLANPSNPSRSQLQTLASNLTSALSAAGPVVAGTSPTVSGADRLTSWAPGAARTLKHRAALKRRAKLKAERKARGNQSTASGTAPSSPNSASPLAGGRDCGSGLYAGPNTTCVFAANVRDAYNEAPGASASVRVFSPATGSTYTMNCAPSGSGVTCSGGNNASVTF